MPVQDSCDVSTHPGYDVISQEGMLCSGLLQTQERTKISNKFHCGDVIQLVSSTAPLPATLRADGSTLSAHRRYETSISKPESQRDVKLLPIQTTCSGTHVKDVPFGCNGAVDTSGCRCVANSAAAVGSGVADTSSCREDKEDSSETRQENEGRCVALERQHVHDVYDRTARHFGNVRYKAWPSVRRFLQELPPGSLVADVGCGHGKYLHINRDIFKLGSDHSAPLVDIAATKGEHVMVCDNLALPYRDNCFDAVISVGVIHHFGTSERRIRALGELGRVLRPGGRVMIYVWALEQEKRKFGSQDVLVPWHLKPKVPLNKTASTLKHLHSNRSVSDSGETFQDSNTGGMTWIQDEGRTARVSQLKGSAKLTRNNSAPLLRAGAFMSESIQASSLEKADSLRRRPHKHRPFGSKLGTSNLPSQSDCSSSHETFSDFVVIHSLEDTNYRSETSQASQVTSQTSHEPCSSSPCHNTCSQSHCDINKDSYLLDDLQKVIGNSSELYNCSQKRVTLKGSQETPVNSSDIDLNGASPKSLSLTALLRKKLSGLFSPGDKSKRLSGSQGQSSHSTGLLNSTAKIISGTGSQEQTLAVVEGFAVREFPQSSQPTTTKRGCEKQKAGGRGHDNLPEQGGSDGILIDQSVCDWRNKPSDQYISERAKFQEADHSSPRENAENASRKSSLDKTGSGSDMENWEAMTTKAIRRMESEVSWKVQMSAIDGEKSKAGKTETGKALTRQLNGITPLTDVSGSPLATGSARNTPKSQRRFLSHSSSVSSFSSDANSETMSDIDNDETCPVFEKPTVTQGPIFPELSLRRTTTVSVNNGTKCNQEIGDNSSEILSDNDENREMLRRYYHVFRKGELDDLIGRHVGCLHVAESFYDHGNWCVIAEKGPYL